MTDPTSKIERTRLKADHQLADAIARCHDAAVEVAIRIGRVIAARAQGELEAVCKAWAEEHRND